MQNSKSWHRRRVRYLALLLALFPGAAAQQTGQGSRFDRTTLPLTSFYDAPHPLPPAKPGSLIRFSSFEGYDLPDEVSAVRLLYHSHSPRGDDVAVSGVVLLPPGKPPAGGWPVIAWAHGFLGAARRCAPSLKRNLGYGSLFSMYLNLGYALVVTDYVGLGTTGRAAVIDIPSNANDVIDAIAAAHAAVPPLGARWVMMGHAGGAWAALGVSEMQDSIRDPGFLGSIAISGGADFEDLYRPPVQGSSGTMLLYLAYAIQTAFPEFQAEQILSKKALPFFDRIQTVCGPAKLGNWPENELMIAGWRNNPFVQKFFQRNRLGQKSAYGPVLIIDEQSTHVISRMCQQGDRVQSYTYPDTQPGNLIGESVGDQISWVESRFAGRPPPHNCR